jgi:hypothetical protein
VAHPSQHLSARAWDRIFFQVTFQSSQQALSVGRTIFSGLVEFHHRGADKPIAKNEGSIDGECGAADGLVV